MSELMRLPVCVPMTVGVCYLMTGDGTSAEEYPGPYEMYPGMEDETLETNGKLMTDDVTLHAIPYTELGDDINGWTAYINCLPK